MKSMSRIGNGTVTVVDDNNNVYMFNNVSENEFSLYIQKYNENDTQFFISKAYPKVAEVIEERNQKSDLLNKIKDNSFFVVNGDYIIVPSISQVSVPESLLRAFVDAFDKKDDDKLTALKNFWTLVCFNPDSRVRQNLFWFLETNGMTISKSGLFTAYRNVDIKSGKNNQEYVRAVTDFYKKVKYIERKNPRNYKVVRKTRDNIYEGNSYFYELCELSKDESPETTRTLLDCYNSLSNEDSETVIYTDNHTHSFTITIGKPVKMEREKCISDPNQLCTKGLHVGAFSWLEENYCGEVGLMVLVNPAKVVSVPLEQYYGKMRVCEYLPVCTIEFNEDHHVKDPGVITGFDDDYIMDFIGEINNDNPDQFKFKLPDTPEISISSLSNSLLVEAKKSCNKILNEYDFEVDDDMNADQLNDVINRMNEYLTTHAVSERNEKYLHDRIRYATQLLDKIEEYYEDDECEDDECEDDYDNTEDEEYKDDYSDDEKSVSKQELMDFTNDDNFDDEGQYRHKDIISKADLQVYYGEDIPEGMDPYHFLEFKAGCGIADDYDLTLTPDIKRYYDRYVDGCYSFAVFVAQVLEKIC